MALRKGDMIRVIAPASSFDRARLYRAIAWLSRQGYRINYSTQIFAKDQYLAGSDERRVRELLSAWNDPKVRAIWVARGGYGSMRLFLRRLKLKRLRQPKIIMALSDLTPFLNFVAHTHGTVTLHGPVLAGDTFLRLSESERTGLLHKLERSEETVLHSSKDFVRLRSGNAVGRLWGGNLAMIQSTLRTPLEIPFVGSLLFLEEVFEPPYRIDRMVTQLALSGLLRKIRGLLLGDFLNPDGKLYSRYWLERWFLPLIPKGVPVLYGLKAGHGKNKVILPIGGRCRIDLGGKRLHLSPLVRD